MNQISAGSISLDSTFTEIQYSSYGLTAENGIGLAIVNTVTYETH